jgi:hypothetical protein
VKKIRSRFFALTLAVGVIVAVSLALTGASPASAATVTPAAHVSTATVRAASPEPLSSNSASGCAGYEVCIDVVGSGLNVQSVTGTVAPIASWCGYETLRGTLNNQTYIFVDSPTACASITSDYQYTWTLNEDFPSGMKICLGQVTKSGTNPGGPACETIEG